MDFIKACYQAKMFEYGPTKGTIFFTPYSFAIWTKIQKYLDESFSKIGVENVYFPSLFPYDMLAQEKKHVAGFQPEIFLVENAGNKKLNKKLVLRPTSEVVFCFYFQKILKSYRDLPLILNQWVNVWRYEQNPNPFLRNMEFLWNEGHTLHLNDKEAIKFCYQILNIYRDCLQKQLLIPVFVGYKSELEKFAGAKKTLVLETILPDGQFLQLATVHYFGQDFAKSFKIEFLNNKNQKSIPFQTSWGISTRTIAGLVQTHYDNKGIVLPFAFARHNFWILPIITKDQTEENNKKIFDYCFLISKRLQEQNFKTKVITDNNKNFKYHFLESEISGVPIRLEIGLKEIQNQSITFVLRHNFRRQNLNFENFFSELKSIYEEMNNEIYAKATKKIINKITKINQFNEYLDQTKDKIFQVWFCNKTSCEKEIKTKTGTVSRLLWKNIEKNGHCFKCLEKTSYQAFFGRSY